MYPNLIKSELTEFFSFVVLGVIRLYSTPMLNISYFFYFMNRMKGMVLILDINSEIGVAVMSNLLLFDVVEAID